MEIDKISERFNQAAAEYDKLRKYFIPCFDDFYSTGITLLAKIRGDFSTVLDLGAGTGLLTKYLRSSFPAAEYTLMDVSDAMIDIARKRFADLNNVSYTIGDYSVMLPSQRFDLIASALSIHHLDEEQKRSLYSNIYNSLNPDGFFLNLDQFNPSSEMMNRYYNGLWFEYIQTSGISQSDRELWLKRRELDKENTVEETMTALKNSGFSAVECVYSYMKFAVILSKK